MKNIRRLAAITLLGLAAAAGAQVNMPNPTLPGASFNTAVRIVATNELMVDRFINRWIRTHYPGWDADPLEFQDIGSDRFAVVYITHPDNPSRRVYFRVVQNYNDDHDDSPFPL
jgi:hypothetical protein